MFQEAFRRWILERYEPLTSNYYLDDFVDLWRRSSACKDDFAFVLGICEVEDQLQLEQGKTKKRNGERIGPVTILMSACDTVRVVEIIH